jgi:hypothetical protein
MAAFDLARSKGKGWEAALKDARQMVYEGHGDYSTINAPRVFQSNIDKMAMLFKKFIFHMAGQMINNVRKALLDPSLSKEERHEAAVKLGMMVVVSGALAGVSGMPAYGICSSLYYLFKSIFGDDEETRDLTLRMRMGLDSMGVNPTLREFWTRGVGSILGADLSGRIGYDSMFYRNPDENLDNQNRLEWALSTFGGPHASLIKQAATGLKDIAAGDLERGMQGFLPSSLRNVWRGLAAGARGQIETRRGDPILDVGPWDAFVQTVGYQPSNVALQQNINVGAKAIDQRINAHHADLLRQYRHAWAKGDTDELADVKADIAKWNSEDVPRMGIPKMVITPRR